MRLAKQPEIGDGKTLRPFVEELLDTDSEDEGEEGTSNYKRNLSTIFEHDEEIEVIQKALKDVECSCHLESSPDTTDQTSQNKSTPSQSDTNNKFELEIGSSKVPRFCCCCHKLNLAIRQAIDEHPDISAILASCNSLGTEVRRSIKKSKPFKKMRCMLRCENATRWSSSFLMVLAILKAFQKGVISVNEEDEHFVNLNRASLEIYFQILKEVHLLSLEFQKIQSSIADVIPGINFQLN